MNQRLSHYLRLLAVVAFIVAINAAFFLVGAREVVTYIGVSNTYLVVFLIAAIGGMSTFTGATYVSTMANFAAGGADPWLLGLFGGVGIFISDSLFYLLAWYGRQVVPNSWRSAIRFLTKEIEELPIWAVMLGAYIYQGLSPLPTDLLMLALAFSRRHYYTLILPLLFGSLTFSWLIAHFGSLWF